MGVKVPFALGEEHIFKVFENKYLGQYLDL
jgi:hypothetical protein